MVNVEEAWLNQTFSHKETQAAASGTAVRRESENPKIVRTDPEAEKTFEAAEHLRSFFPEWTVETEFLTGSPSSALINRAREWNADLVVAGALGQCSNNRFGLGSVSQKLANEAPCSVRITRGHGAWKNGAPVRIVIGFDGTPLSEAAVDEVARRFWTMGSEVHVVVALDKPNIFSLSNPEDPVDSDTIRTNETYSSWLSDFLDKSRAILSRAELQVSELLEEGDPRQIIVAEAEEWGSDCIFIGAGNNRGTADKVLLGNVATAVLTRAHCTVEIIRK
jgi:nucleotide-binding universal stress UspA family protein